MFCCDDVTSCGDVCSRVVFSCTQYLLGRLYYIKCWQLQGKTEWCWILNILTQTSSKGVLPNRKFDSNNQHSVAYICSLHSGHSDFVFKEFIKILHNQNTYWLTIHVCATPLRRTKSWTQYTKWTLFFYRKLRVHVDILIDNHVRFVWFCFSSTSNG